MVRLICRGRVARMGARRKINDKKMNEVEFRKSAECIAKRNITDRVISIVVTFDQRTGKLKVIYCLCGEPREGDRENCELTCAELIAEFPEVKLAETLCVPITQCPEESSGIGGVVFSSRSQS